MAAAAKSKTKRPKSGAKKKKGAARKRAAPAASLSSALAEAAWAEADAALAEALAELDAFEGAETAAARADAASLLAQALARAGRKRGLSRLGVVGDRVAYDAALHDLSVAGSKKPKNVRIQVRGVTRGADVLVKPRVAPIGRKKKRQ
ncbi:MAG: hypothetical protein U1E03_09730 [Hyphomonadaceae bacterium]